MDFGSSSGKSITVPAGNEFQFGTGDFTIESWVYVRNGANFTLYDSGQDVNSGGSFAFWCEGGAIKVRIDGVGHDFSAPFNSSWLNNWAHYAVVRNLSLIHI